MMKTHFNLLIAVLCLSVFSLSAQALDLHQVLNHPLTQQQHNQLLFDIPNNTVPLALDEDDVTELFQKLSGYYQSYIQHNDSAISQFDFLMDKNNARQLLKITHLVNFAVEQRLSLIGLEDFGMNYEDAGAGGYAYYLEQSPHLVSPFGLLRTIYPSWGYKEVTRESQQWIFEQLLKRGFRQSDIDTLFDYISKNHAWKLARIGQYADELIESVEIEALVRQKMVVDSDYYLQRISRLAYSSKRIRNFVWQQWGTALLALFDQPRQRILKSYFIEKLSGTVGIKAMDNNDSFVGLIPFEQAIESGEKRKAMLQAIKKITEEEF